MSDLGTDGSDVSEEAESLIQELLDGGFSYEPNDRVAGLAPRDEEPDEDDSVGAGDGGSDGSSADDSSSDDGSVDGVPPGDDEAASDSGHPGVSPSNGPLSDLSSEEQAGLFQLRQMLIEHPELSSKFNDLVTETFERKPVEEEAKGDDSLTDALPDWIDPDEPAQVAMFRRTQELEGKVAGIERRSEEAITAADQARVKSDIASGVDLFISQHPELNDEDISNIRNYTQANVNVGGVMANFPGDPAKGIARSLEIGSMTDPSTRDKVLGINKTNPSETDKRRQSDLNGLGGGSNGGTPRRPAKEKKPSSWNEVAQRLAKELESMGPS